MSMHWAHHSGIYQKWWKTGEDLSGTRWLNKSQGEFLCSHANDVYLTFKTGENSELTLQKKAGFKIICTRSPEIADGNKHLLSAYCVPGTVPGLECIHKMSLSFTAIWWGRSHFRPTSHVRGVERIRRWFDVPRPISSDIGTRMQGQMTVFYHLC